MTAAPADGWKRRMTDTTSPAVDALRRLFAVEFACPTSRLKQSMPFLSWADTREEHPLRHIADEDREHQDWLAQLLFERGTAPPPASFATATAGMHYIRLDTLLPAFVQAEREVLAAFQAAAPALADDPDAARVVARIIARHTEHLATFQALEKPAG
jgi:hypothetical protein